MGGEFGKNETEFIGSIRQMTRTNAAGSAQYEAHSHL